MHRPGPVAGVAPAAGIARALLDLTGVRTGGLLRWRTGQAVAAKVVATAPGSVLLQAGQHVVSAKTGLALPVGAEAEFVVRGVQDRQVELQLVAVKTVQTAAADSVPRAAMAEMPASDAWQLAFVLPGDAEAQVAGWRAGERDARNNDGTQDSRDGPDDDGERIVVRWESRHLGQVEIELDVGPATGGEPRLARLAARASPGAMAAIRSGLPALSEKLSTVGLAVRTRTVSPLRRQRQPAPAVRLDARL